MRGATHESTCVCEVILERYRISRLMVSKSRGQEEAGLCDEPVSYLQAALL